MIEALSGWAEQIVVAVIIASLIEMILPNGNNKKYIKTVLGIYILFTILSPILGKVTNFNLNEVDYESYFKNTDTYQTMSESLSSKNDQSVEDIYIANLKQDMTQKLKEKGYLAEKITIKLNLEDGENYGRLNAIYLTAYLLDENEDDTQTSEDIVANQIQISKVEKVNVTNQISNDKKETKKKKNLSSVQKNEIKKYLSTVYEVKEKNIEVNEEED